VDEMNEKCGEVVETTGVPDAKHWKLILDAKAAVDDAESVVEDAEGTLNEAKASLKAAESRRNTLVNALRNIIEDAKHGQGHLDFDAPSKEETDENWWRSVGIEELTLGSREAKALTDAELVTLGAIADWTQTKPLTDIKGIGESGAEKIEAAIEEYYRLHPVTDIPGEGPEQTEGVE
jgi:hypothetical protein